MDRKQAEPADALELLASLAISTKRLADSMWGAETDDALEHKRTL